MFVQNHHSLEELQRLTKALTKKRIWLRHQAVVLAKQGQPPPPARSPGPGMLSPRRSGPVDRYNQGGLAALQGAPTPDAGPALPRRTRAGSVTASRRRPPPRMASAPSAARTCARILEEESGAASAGRLVYDLLHRLDLQQPDAPAQARAGRTRGSGKLQGDRRRADRRHRRGASRGADSAPISRMKPASRPEGDDQHGPARAGSATACGSAPGIHLALRARRPSPAATGAMSAVTACPRRAPRSSTCSWSSSRRSRRRRVACGAATRGRAGLPHRRGRGGGRGTRAAREIESAGRGPAWAA